MVAGNRRIRVRGGQRRPMGRRWGPTAQPVARAGRSPAPAEGGPERAVVLTAGISSGGRAIAADFGPARYQLPVGSGVDAELSGLQVGRLIRVALVETRGQAGAFGKQVGPSGCHLDQLGYRPVVLGIGQFTPARITPGGARQLRHDDPVPLSDCHPATIEHVFDYATDHAGTASAGCAPRPASAARFGVWRARAPGPGPRAPADWPRDSRQRRI